MSTSLSGYRPKATGISGLKGTGFKGFSLPAFDQGQQNIYQQRQQDLGPDSMLSRLAHGDQGQFEQMEAPAWRDLAAAQGGIASRFSQGGQGPGALGSQKSSGFKNTMGALGSDFAQRLQGNRLNLQRQAMSDLFGMSNQLLQQRPTDNYMMQEQKPWWQELITSGVHGLAEGAGSSLAGGGIPWGSIAGKLFGGKGPQASAPAQRSNAWGM